MGIKPQTLCLEIKDTNVNVADDILECETWYNLKKKKRVAVGFDYCHYTLNLCF